MTTSSRAGTWCGPSHSPLFAVVHSPSSQRAKAAVVVCPPLGRERLQTYRGLKYFAQSLAEHEIAALHFDYPATGESAGIQVDVEYSQWVESISSAVDYVRDSGVEHVYLAGLRVGANLALDAVAAGVDAAGVIAWDPILRGRGYLREQKAVSSISIGEDEPIPGAHLLHGSSISTSCADGISSWKFASQTQQIPEGTNFLCAGRADQRDKNQALVQSLNARGVHASYRELTNPETFVTPPEFLLRYPDADIAFFTNYIAELATDFPARPFTPHLRDSAQLGSTASGEPIIERITAIEPHGLFAITTEIGEEAHSGVVFFSTSTEPRFGPDRLWTTLARSLPAGTLALRFDRQHTGESCEVSADELVSVYSQVARADGEAAVAWMAAQVPQFLLAGICSGGWHAVDSLLRHGMKPGQQASIIAAGPQMWSVDPEEFDRDYLVNAGWDLTLGSAPLENSDESRMTDMKTFARHTMPYRAWKFLAQRGKVQCPEEMFAQVNVPNVQCQWVFPGSDYDLFVANRGPDSLVQLAQRGVHPQLHILEGNEPDHVFNSNRLRGQLRAIILDTMRAMHSSKNGL